MTKHIRLAALWFIGASIGFAGMIANIIVSILSLAPEILVQSFIIWIAFNISVGSIFLFQISFIQSFGFVLLIRVVRKMFVNE